MVARLKLKGIDGRAHKEWSLRLDFRPSERDQKRLLNTFKLFGGALEPHLPRACRKTGKKSGVFPPQRDSRDRAPRLTVGGMVITVRTRDTGGRVGSGRC